MSVIKGCSSAVRVSVDPLIPMPGKQKKHTTVGAEKKQKKKLELYVC